MALSKNALMLLRQRYCHSGESPKDVYKRVANALSLGDNKFEKHLQKSMDDGIFLPNSPCIRNAGLKKSMLHACFVLDVLDTMESISDTLKNMIIIFKNGGGVGINFSKLRPKNSILGSGGTSSGVVSFMKLFDTATEVIKQGGFRRGALMGVLNFEHAEIIDFIRSKLTNTLTNFNISVLVSDKFMEKVEKGENIDLINPQDDKVWNTINAKTIFDVIAFSAWHSGDPGFLFYDRINKDNIYFPKIKIKCSNPCQPFNSLLLDEDKLIQISYKANTWTSWSTGIKEVLELICNNGLKLRFTSDHLIMLENNNFIEAKNSLGKNLKWGLGNRIAINFDEKEILRGFLFGDGFLCANKKGISVKLNSNKEYQVAQLLLKNKFILENSGSYYINRNKMLNVDFLENRVFNRDLPDDILYGDSNKTASFMRGLFEAKGSCNIVSQISLKSTCKSMIEKVQIVLASFGIPSWISINPSSIGHFKNGDYLCKESYNLQIAPRNAWIFKEKIGFYSNYKNSRIKYKNQPYKSKLIVKEIKSLGFMEVWDYQMNQEPMYNFCQGIIAHNCGESPLPPFGACCLGSINISKLVKHNKFNFDLFAKYLEIATRSLRNMNAVSWYPLPEITKVMKELDPIGVGIMGFADCLIKLSIQYDSEETLKFIDELCKPYKEITDKLASKCFWKRIIAPTGSLSILADCSSGIEPIFDTTFERHLTVGIIEETRDIYKSKYTRTSHQISPEWHLKIQAQFQKWLDGSISKTINLPNEASVDDVKNIYLQAWKLGCKGITIFRENSKEGVLRKKSKCDDGSCHL